MDLRIPATSQPRLVIIGGGFGGIELAQKLSHLDIQIVLLDKHMPDMDGFEVYKEMKTINNEVKVVLLTGLEIDDEIKGLFSQNLCGCIQKPVSIEKLSSSIAEALYKNEL